MAYAIVDLATAEIVPQRGRSALTFTSLDRVRFPDGATVDGAAPGYEFPPQYPDEAGLPVAFRIYEIVVVDVGSGPRVASTSDPVFDPAADTVTVTRTMEAALPPPDPADQAEQRMTEDPFTRAWARREARREGKTVRQIVDEIRADA